MRFPIVPVLIIVAIVAGIIGLYVYALNVIRMNEVPSITVSEVTPTEGGCTAQYPFVTFEVRASNMAFGDGTVRFSFYQDGVYLGSKEWTVPGRNPDFRGTVWYAIQECGGHVYNWQLDAITGT